MQDIPEWSDSVIAEDEVVRDDIWWDTRNGGTGAGYNINAILPILPAPLVGMQGWYDTVCSIRKIQIASRNTSTGQPVVILDAGGKPATRRLRVTSNIRRAVQLSDHDSLTREAIISAKHDQTLPVLVGFDPDRPVSVQM